MLSRQSAGVLSQAAERNAQVRKINAPPRSTRMHSLVPLGRGSFTPISLGGHRLARRSSFPRVTILRPLPNIAGHVVKTKSSAHANGPCTRHDLRRTVIVTPTRSAYLSRQALHTICVSSISSAPRVVGTSSHATPLRSSELLQSYPYRSIGFRSARRRHDSIHPQIIHHLSSVVVGCATLNVAILMRVNLPAPCSMFSGINVAAVFVTQRERIFRN